MHKYQIVIFPSKYSEADLIRVRVGQQLDVLGLSPDTYEFFDERDCQNRDRDALLVAVYLGLLVDDGIPPECLSDLRREATLIIPVVPTLEHVRTHLPSELRQLNALEWRDVEKGLARVTSLLLESLSLLRTSRRLFISYRRVETSALAIQLFEFLEAHGFDVFLDTHSVPIGEPFQDVLWHRLADTDVIVVLDSPGFMGSFWTMEEITRANSTRVEMVQMIWPNAPLLPDHGFNYPFFLEEVDFESQDLQRRRLVLPCLDRLVTVIESVRARALAARHTYLLESFVKSAEALGMSPQLLSERFISLKTPSARLAAVPAVGVPTARTLHEIEERLSGSSPDFDRVVMLYDERGILAKWIRHLEWLNSYRLKVISIEISKAALWLRSL